MHYPNYNEIGPLYTAVDCLSRETGHLLDAEDWYMRDAFDLLVFSPVMIYADYGPSRYAFAFAP